MRIQPSQNNIHTPNFGKISRAVYQTNKTGSAKRILHRNDSSFFRDDFFWVRLTNILGEKYKNSNKVNVIEYACSNGSETYSFILMMLSSLGERAKKFFPVIAIDFDEYVINIAKSGLIEITTDEIMTIEHLAKCSVGDFFDLTKTPEKKVYATPKPILKENAIFEKADVLTEMYNLPKSEDTVLLARNFWPFLKLEDARNLIKVICERLDKNSTLVLGRLDENYFCSYKGVSLSAIFQQEGFKSVDNSGLILVR